jgi:hypothetical protein
MVNQLFSNFVQLRKCGESSYLSIAIKNLDLDKNFALGDFFKSKAQSKKIIVVISTMVQTSINP